MRRVASRGLITSVAVLVIGVAVHGVASAQTDNPTAAVGVITGEVAHCVNGAEQPAGDVAVGVEGGSATLARTDAHGEFLLALPVGQYTVVATASDGMANRQYVPVEGGQALDIGVLDIGGGVAGCGPDSDVTAPVLPTFTVSPAATLEAPTPTPAPTAPPATPTPAPAPDPDMTEPVPPPEMGT